MEKDEIQVEVEYKTKTDYCRCCGHELKEPKISENRKFFFSKESFNDWLEEENWKISMEEDEEFQSMIEEFVYETISFFATSSDARLIIAPSEIQKVKQFCSEQFC